MAGETSSSTHSHNAQFCEYLAANLVSGLDGNGTPAQYIPYAKLREYWTDDEIDEYLATLELVESRTLIRERYLRVFSILVATGMARYIDDFMRHDLDDHRAAPLEEAQLSCLPHVPDFELLCSLYREKQWMFCPVEFSTQLYKKHLDHRCILPIAERKTFDGGDSGVAVTQMVKLNADCVRPWDEDIVVFKTYKKYQAPFNSEIEAFLSIASRHGSQYVVRYYGSFIQDEDYTIILEYANGGSLLQFYKTTQPPKTWEDLRKFWTSMFCLLESLAVIHNVGTAQTRGRSKTFQAVHQDIKPSNILVFMKPGGTSAYDIILKFADFGMSHTLAVEVGNRGPNAIDRGSTRTYGSPKVCRTMAFQDALDVTVSWQDDIWSMGCVYSEAAVWCVSGEEGRDEYRNLRRSQVPQHLRNAGYEVAFHNGEVTLEAVHEMHRRIHYRRIVVDTITFKVGELVLRSMIRVDDGGPLDASQLRTRCVHRLAEAEHALKRAWPTWPKLPSPFSRSRQTANTASPVPSITRSSTGSQSIKSEGDCAMNVPDPTTAANAAAAADADRGRRSSSLSRRPSSVVLPHQSHPPQCLVTPSNATSAGGSAAPPAVATAGTADRSAASPVPRFAANPSRVEPHARMFSSPALLSSRNGHVIGPADDDVRRRRPRYVGDPEDGNRAGGPGSPIPHWTAQPSWQHKSDSAIPSRPFAANVSWRGGGRGADYARPESGGGGGSSFGYPMVRPDLELPSPVMMPATQIPGGGGFGGSLSPTAAAPLGSPASDSARKGHRLQSGYPSVTIDDVLHCRKRKDGIKQLDGWDLAKNYVKGREQIFLIDDGSSMRTMYGGNTVRHVANELCKAFEAMAVLAQASDPNKIEVRFASDVSKQQRGSFDFARSGAHQVDAYVERLRDRFESSPSGSSSGGRCDMEAALNRVLSAVRNQLFDARNQRRPPGRYSVYVLTDGVWLPESEPGADGAGGVENPLLMIIKQLRDDNLTQDQVMVQFVRFGHDPVGKRRLRWLDNDLKRQPKADGYDIVDRRKVTSGIWPIFIGSLNRAEDDHDDSSGDEGDDMQAASPGADGDVVGRHGTGRGRDYDVRDQLDAVTIRAGDAEDDVSIVEKKWE